MRIDLKSVGVRLSEGIRVRVQRRVLLALTRFGPRIRRVTVSLDELPNPLGGIDRRCRIRARLQEGEELRTEAIDGEFEAAAVKSAALLVKRVDSLPGADRASSEGPSSRTGIR
jgi:hypothetical protein